MIYLLNMNKLFEVLNNYNWKDKELSLIDDFFNLEIKNINMKDLLPGIEVTWEMFILDMSQLITISWDLKINYYNTKQEKLELLQASSKDSFFMLCYAWEVYLLSNEDIHRLLTER